MTSPMTGRTAIVGHRSWISQKLTEVLVSQGQWPAPIHKDFIGTADMSLYDCVYLVLGRARPNEAEDQAERDQVKAFLKNPRKPKRAVYISSQLLSAGKLWCENELGLFMKNCSVWHCFITIIRPPAVFGPDQDINSEMLIPSLARTNGALELRTPNYPSEFISVHDLALHLTKFSDVNWHDINRCGQPDSIFWIPGTFSATPSQLASLYRTFIALHSAARAEAHDCGADGAIGMDESGEG